MGRKAKIIEKSLKKDEKKDQRQEIKTQHHQDPQSQKQQSKGEEKKEKINQNEQFNQLKQKIQAKYNDFRMFAIQIYKLKGQKSDESIKQQVQKKIESANQKLELASQIFLKQEMKSVQNLIICQKQKISEDIIKIKKAYDESKLSLQTANVFSQQQIASQLSHIQKKITLKQQALSKFQEFYHKSKAF